MSRLYVIGILVVVIIIPLLLLSLYLSQNDLVSVSEFGSLGKPKVYIENVPINVDVADTEEERVRGLSGRTSLPPDSGLLFVFDKDASYGIWMRGMYFPLDIIWISRDLKVVDIRERVLPDSYPNVLYPKVNARYVLEVNALFVETHGIRVGDKVKIPEQYLSRD